MTVMQAVANVSAERRPLLLPKGSVIMLVVHEPFTLIYIQAEPACNKIHLIGLRLHISVGGFIARDQMRLLGCKSVLGKCNFRLILLAQFEVEKRLDDLGVMQYKHN